MKVDNLTTVSLLPALSRTATTDVNGVDVSKFIGAVKFILDAAAASAGTNPTLNVTIETSATIDDDFEELAAFAQVTDAAALFASLHIDARLFKKYVRATGTIAGTDNPAFVFSVVLIGLQHRV